MTIQRFRLTLLAGTEVRFKPLMSLRPANGMPMVLSSAPA